MKKTLFLLSGLICVMLFSCRKEIEKPSWDTEVLAPLVNANLGINNLLPDSILKNNPDGSLKIVYQGDIYQMDTLFTIPDTSIHKSFANPFGISLALSPGMAVVPTVQTETTYDLNGMALRTATIKSGYMKYTIKSMVHGITDLEYSIPCAKLNGVPFSVKVSIPAAVGYTPGIYSQTYDMSGYVIDLTGISHNKVNTIYTAMSSSISLLESSAVTVAATDSIIVDNTFSEIIPYYAKGYFGQNTIDVGPEESHFDFFKRIIDGTIGLENVDIKLKIENPIGIDARVIINNLSSYNSNTGNSVSLNNSIINSSININRASENNGIVYPSIATFPLNTSNSNIKQFIENLPDKLSYSMHIATNPLGNISGSNDFVYSNKLLKASLDMEIPLSLVANNLTLADTFDLNISSNGTQQNIHSGTITLFANNGFPFDATLQMYLLNKNNIITDSIFGYTNTIDEAPINSELKVIDKKLTKIVIPFDENKMNELYATKKAMLKIKFNTSHQPQYMKIYSDYKIDIKLVGDLNYTVQLH